MEEIVNHLKNCLKQPLLSIKAHNEMLPESRKQYPETPANIAKSNKSGVLLLFYPKNNDVNIVFIKRTVYNGVHSGQIAFPGGKIEKDDRSLTDTAIREANEEIGVNKKNIEILGKLSDLFIPPSNNIVSPFIGIYNTQINFKLNKNEVSKIIEVPLTAVLDHTNRTTSEVVAADGLIYKVPCFNFNNNIVWGATAMILNEFVALWNSI